MWWPCLDYRRRYRLFRSWLRWLQSHLWEPRPGCLLLRPPMGCRTCRGRAPLMCCRCWTVCRGASTSHDDYVDQSDLNPAYGFHLHDPRLLEYAGAPESARLLSHTPEYWIHHMGREQSMSTTLQLQHDAGLILSNLQVIGQCVTSLNRMSSEVMRVAFDHEPFPMEAVQSVAPTHRFQRPLTTWRRWDSGVRRVRFMC